MFDRYTLFRRLMSMTSEFGTVTDARLRNYCGDIEVSGRSGRTSIAITVAITEEGETDDDGVTGVSIRTPKEFLKGEEGDV